MSADAKVWEDQGCWRGAHDGPCRAPVADEAHQEGTLVRVLTSIEACDGTAMRWAIRAYPDGTTGLVGWSA